MRNEIVRARVSTELKHNSEAIFDKLGMSMSDAIRIFLNQVSIRNEFPLELKMPNQKTLEAMNSLPTDDVFDSADDLFAEVLK